MGRSGGGGGGSHSSGGHGHHTSHSSGGYHSSSSRSYSSRPSGPSHYGPSHGPSYSRPPRRYSSGNTVIYNNVGGNGGSGTGCGCTGCSSYIFVGLIILLIFMIICSSTGNTTIGGGYLIKDEIADNYADELYKEKFGNANDGAVFLISEADNWEDEYITFSLGSKAREIMDKYMEQFYTIYDRHYDDDVAFQTAESIYDWIELMANGGEYGFDAKDNYKGQNYIVDGVNAFDTEANLAKAMESFYKATGIKLYVVAANYDKFGPKYGAEPEKGTDFTTVFVVLIICIAIILVIWILYKWWQARKKQKNIEDENTIKILNAPLQTFGDVDLTETAAKYDDK